jgi:hypothetical protein
VKLSGVVPTWSCTMTRSDVNFIVMPVGSAGSSIQSR